MLVNVGNYLSLPSPSLQVEMKVVQKTFHINVLNQLVS